MESKIVKKKKITPNPKIQITLAHNKNDFPNENIKEKNKKFLFYWNKRRICFSLFTLTFHYFIFSLLLAPPKPRKNILQRSLISCFCMASKKRSKPLFIAPN
jgi:hypothetical protein